MPKRKSKIKYFYIDTSIALDYATGRNIDTILVLEKIKEKKWKCVSSTFLSMEMADYKKNYLFVEKALAKKWELSKILREKDKKELKQVDFENTIDWFEDFKNKFKKIQLYDFLQNDEEWQFAQGISFNSNLTAPDVIHLSSAIIGSTKGYPKYFITGDKGFYMEAKRIIGENKIRGLEILTIAEVKKKFFKLRK